MRNSNSKKETHFRTRSCKLSQTGAVAAQVSGAREAQVVLGTLVSR